MVALVWLAAEPTLAEVERAVRVMSFESATIGALPDGFSAALTGGGGAAVWEIGEDPSSPAGPKVLVQTSQDETRKRYPLCIYERFSARDVDLRVRFKPIAGKVDQAAGLVFRYRDPAHYYIVRANALEGNVVLYKVERGERSDLKPVGAGLGAYGKEARVRSGAWQQLRVEVRGDLFRVSLDGSHLFDVRDATFAGPGKVGLWTKADSVTAFDELAVEALDSQAEGS